MAKERNPIEIRYRWDNFDQRELWHGHGKSPEKEEGSNFPKG